MQGAGVTVDHGHAGGIARKAARGEFRQVFVVELVTRADRLYVISAFDAVDKAVAEVAVDAARQAHQVIDREHGKSQQAYVQSAFAAQFVGAGRADKAADMVVALDVLEVVERDRSVAAVDTSHDGFAQMRFFKVRLIRVGHIVVGFLLIGGTQVPVKGVIL